MAYLPDVEVCVLEFLLDALLHLAEQQVYPDLEQEGNPKCVLHVLKKKSQRGPGLTSQQGNTWAMGGGLTETKGLVKPKT